MPPKISTIVFKLYTPTKRKFKPFKNEKTTMESPRAFDSDEIYSEWSGIHSEDDSEWPPISPSSLAKPVLTPTLPKSPSLSFSNDGYEFEKEAECREQKYALTAMK